jgi:ribonuclease VapC
LSIPPADRDCAARAAVRRPALQAGGSDGTSVGAPTRAEAKIVLTAKGQDADALLGPIVRAAAIAIVPFGPAHHVTALDAFVRYGKRRHPAGLNFGDCLAYAVAKLAGEPLLCKGGDFAKTDLDLA